MDYSVLVSSSSSLGYFKAGVTSFPSSFKTFSHHISTFSKYIFRYVNSGQWQIFPQLFNERRYKACLHVEVKRLSCFEVRQLALHGCLQTSVQFSFYVLTLHLDNLHAVLISSKNNHKMLKHYSENSGTLQSPFPKGFMPQWCSCVDFLIPDSFTHYFHILMRTFLSAFFYLDTYSPKTYRKSLSFQILGLFVWNCASC